VTRGHGDDARGADHDLAIDERGYDAHPGDLGHALGDGRRHDDGGAGRCRDEAGQRRQIEVIAVLVRREDRVEAGEIRRCER
jgi:hypothetical protein